MNNEHITQTNIHAAAVTALTFANVWLLVQNIRWLMYSNPVSSLLPYVDKYSLIDPILEVPGILVGLLAAYVLVYRYALSLWRIRQSIFRHSLYTRVMTINSILLVVLTLLGILQWKVWFNELAIDVIIAASFGILAALVSVVMEWRLSASDHFMPERTMPLHSLKQIASVWRDRS